MKNKELFAAVTGQCVWCAEQWPVTSFLGHLTHVGPFTKDPKLFHHPCDASQIRLAFHYEDYKGGKQIKFKPRSPKEINEALAECKRQGKPIMVLDSPGNRSFWRGPIQATLEVATWPDWMRQGSEKTSPERLKQCRDELCYFDEIDWWARQPCSDNLQYRPHWNEAHTNLVKPSCNSGFGCITCWERYEKEYDRISANWCD